MSLVSATEVEGAAYDHIIALIILKLLSVHYKKYTLQYMPFVPILEILSTFVLTIKVQFAGFVKIGHLKNYQT